ncbi:MAG: hypothetical protein ORN23_00155 [Chthoniobacterales bacterium]|nr:hypothetical protein [Chthoniobacterales bacterium]
MKSEKQQLLAPRQAAALAGVSTVAIWKAQQRGEIRAAAFKSRGALYDRADIKEWMRCRRIRQRRSKVSLKLNPGKATGFLSIEGISGGFGIWHRRMAREIPSWGEAEISRAVELLLPIAELWAELHHREEPFRVAREKVQVTADKRRELRRLSAVSD